MRAGLALQVVSGGVAWLVDRQLRAARQLNRSEQPPALVAGWVGDDDAPGSQVCQRLLDVVTHQVELVLAWPVCGMHGDLGWRQLEDQPATAGVDPCKSEHVTAFRFVLLCPPLRASGQHPRMVKRPDVEGVDLPSAQTVIVIFRGAG